MWCDAKKVHEKGIVCYITIHYAIMFNRCAYKASQRCSSLYKLYIILIAPVRGPFSSQELHQYTYLTHHYYSGVHSTWIECLRIPVAGKPWQEWLHQSFLEYQYTVTSTMYQHFRFYFHNWKIPVLMHERANENVCVWACACTHTRHSSTTLNEHQEPSVSYQLNRANLWSGAVCKAREKKSIYNWTLL